MNVFQRVTPGHLRVALLVLLAILLGWGGLKLWAGVQFGAWLDQMIPNGVIFGAVVIFAWNRWLVGEAAKREAQEKAEEATPETPKDS